MKKILISLLFMLLAGVNLPFIISGSFWPAAWVNVLSVVVIFFLWMDILLDYRMSDWVEEKLS